VSPTLPRKTEFFNRIGPKRLFANGRYRVSQPAITGFCLGRKRNIADDDIALRRNDPKRS